LLAIAIVIGAWQCVVWAHFKPEYLVPSPFTVFDHLYHDLGDQASAAVVTLRRGVQGFGLAMLIGGVVGIGVARVKVLRAAIGSMITGLQTMPSVAWVPLAIILFKEGPSTVTFVVVIGAAPSIANGIILGIDHVPPVLLRAGRVLGARGLGALRLIVIPAALPSVAWVPLAIILFKEGQGTVTFVVVIGAAPSIANGIINGIDHVPPLLLRAGRMLGARGLGALRHVVIPAALPAVIGGLKQGWAFAWRSLMAAELIGGLNGRLGIGQLLNAAQVQADYTGVFEAMIVILVIGILVDSLVFGTADRAIRRRYGLIDAAS